MSKIVSPRDMAMLCRVLDRTTPPGTSAVERLGRAATVVRLFQSGIELEQELVSVLGGESQDHGPDHGEAPDYGARTSRNPPEHGP